MTRNEEEQPSTQASRCDASGSGHWLARIWRPTLMLVLTALLLMTGIVVPAIEMLAGHALYFHPRWDHLPPGFWNFLSIGTTGYIGGRSLEKIAGLMNNFPANRQTRSQRD